MHDHALPARWNFDDFWGSEAFLRLPMDAMPSGRLLPLARFIQSPLQGTIGKEAEISVFDPTAPCSFFLKIQPDPLLPLNRNDITSF